MDTGNAEIERKLNDARVLQGFLRGARIGLWVIEIEDGRAPRMYANETMRNLLGITGEVTPEECYAFWYARISPQYEERVQQAVARIIAMEFAEVYYDYEHPTAGTLFIRCGGTRDYTETRFISLSGYHQNITELQAVASEEDKLRSDNEELLYSLHNIFTSLYRIDPVTCRVKAVRSPDDYLLAGEQDYAAFQETAMRFLHPDDRETFRMDFSTNHMEELWQHGARTFVREYRRFRHGEYRWTAFQLYFCDLSEGRKWGILGTWDVHERRNREEQRTQALADACRAAETSMHAKMEFLSRMSHDVRTPLNTILGMTTLARAMRNDPGQIMTCIDRIDQAGAILSHLVDEILDASRAENNQIRLERDLLRISTLVNDCADEVRSDAAHRNIAVHTVIHVQHDYVYGDRTRLREILMNFLSNAVKYTRYSGKIVLTVTELPAATGGVGYRFDCEDNGIGISEEFLPKVFGAFEREEDSRVTRTPGTGLGLAITQSLVTLMNGHVAVKSVKGEGSCFTAVVYLEPQETGAITEHGTAADDGSEVRLDGIRILVVEDNEINREIVEELLRMAGAETEGVENGLEAVHAYEQRSERYDVILMDIKMPIMDGNEATQRIRRFEQDTGRRIPIIALTANSFAEDVAESLAAGVDRHITKPYNQQQLIRTIRDLHARIIKERNT